MSNEIKVWPSEYELRQFIDMAIRWKIEVIYTSRTEDRPFSMFTHYVNNARYNYELFSSQLNDKLTQNENWRAVGIDLKSRFLIGIERYIKWYGENKSEFEKFQPYCPYTIMLSTIESTKDEILKYFPEFGETPPPVVEENTPNKPTAELLSDLITHESSVDISEKIKVKYKGIKGKRLKLLLMAFQDLGLIQKEQIGKRFHACCKKEFNWNIASYPAMNDYNYNKHTDSVEFDEMKDFIQALIKQ